MGLEKNCLTSKDHTRTACRLHDHTRGKNNTNKKQYKNSKNSTGKVEKRCRARCKDRVSARIAKIGVKM